MKARAALKAATAEDHGRVDALFARLDLAGLDDYRTFLCAQAAAFLPIEVALDAAGAATVFDDWPGRRRADLLRADLDQLGAPPLPPIAAPPLGDPAEIAGAVYVLEGSRLGGAFLKRALPPTAPRRFLDAPQPPGSWRKLLEKLETLLYRSEQLDSAARSARRTFARFEAAGRHYLETDQACVKAIHGST
ncbi:MAG: biliverdin-producing heme oxygenase [Allosphingosinicella sp.]|uniref:biliverdin-producing heme oxygenase n=1 Tax=Allosphingosinicella sp. TaxID=2823234 RepID=UPI0039268E4E